MRNTKSNNEYLGSWVLVWILHDPVGLETSFASGTLLKKCMVG